MRPAGQRLTGRAAGITLQIGGQELDVTSFDDRSGGPDFETRGPESVQDRRRAAQYAAVADIVAHLATCGSPAEAARVAAESARMVLGAAHAFYAIGDEALPPCALSASAHGPGITISLGLDEAPGEEFTAEDVSLLQRFAQAAAGAIETINAVERERAARRVAEDSTARLTHDLQQRERYESLLAAQKEIFEQIASGAPPAVTLDSIARTIERLSGSDVTASVLLLEDGRLRHGAAPNVPRFYIDAVDGIEIGPEAASCGAAAFRRTTVVTADIQTDDTWAAFRDVARRAGLAACWSTPLIDAGGTVLGTIAMYSSTPRTPHPAELSVLEVFSKAATVAIHNAQTDESNMREREATQAAYEERDRVATVLQTSLLPPALPPIPGIDVEARYRAGSERVGGDFYDVFPLQGRDWGIAIGDVCGKGPDAAALTALARHSIRTGAMLQRQPSRVLQILNQSILRGGADGRFATAIFARLTPRSRGARMVLARGGHPPVAILRSWGDVMFLDGRGTLLGVFDDAPCSDETVDLAPGDAAVFYTDGVIESRRDGSLFGQERLRKLLASCRGMDAGHIARRIESEAAAYRDDEAADDMAILVVTILQHSRGG